MQPGAVEVYDIFQIEGFARPTWMESASALDAAKARVRSMQEAKRCTYMIQSQTTGERWLFPASSGNPGPDFHRTVGR